MTPQTFSLLHALATAFFFATWFVLGVVFFVVFYLGKDAQFKRKWFPRCVFLAVVLFAVFSSTLTALQDRSLKSLGMLVVVVPMACLIAYLNIKFTRFFGNCGETIPSQNWFAPLNFCQSCGAKIDSKPKSDDRSLE